MKIIVDAMGGDYAPKVVVEGAIVAVREYNIEVCLVGDEQRIMALLKKYRYTEDNISICPAQEIIEMSEPAAQSVRKKRNSSIYSCFRCGREGHYAPSCYASKHINGYYLKK